MATDTSVATDKTLLRMAVVGTSHVQSLFEGYQMIASQLPARLELSFIAQGPRKLAYAVFTPGGFERRDPNGTLAELVGESDATHLFVSWKGSQVNIRGLLQQGSAFDVVLAGDANRVIDPAVDLVPCSAVEAFIRGTLDGELARLIAAGRQRGARVWLMGPPPALPETAVRARLAHESHFASRLREIGLSAESVRIVDEPVRVRLHALLLDVYRKFAAEHDAGFCPPPPEVADEAGLLRPQYWGQDITHGNAAYGAAYVQQLVRVATADRD